MELAAIFVYMKRDHLNNELVSPEHKALIPWSSTLTNDGVDESIRGFTRFVEHRSDTARISMTP